ncbi:juvenile hormone acid O-methyltransferase isoform X1 [Adelges cooleyi]|uniref:juvenile hormone acid O-methyltransferase isoform X1 n=1 Tax=Adelges cooleyi TaxID=133065 RepID=UPI00217FFB5F|nr:juvenile hormone acid O-methyltransferase isoform X1 [Adelges cooleyi]
MKNFVVMDRPELYAEENGMQRRDASDALNNYLSRMVWKPREVVLDVGCGPGDVTSDILFPVLQDKIEKLIAVDKSNVMIDYAKSTYGKAKMEFQILDIENSISCAYHTQHFDKIFSFFCFHWIQNKERTLLNLYSMLKSGGEVLILFMLVNPMVHLYKCLDVEWQKYVKDIKHLSSTYSKEEVEALFVNAGFRIIEIESNIKTYTFQDLSSVLNAVKAVDVMYNVLPSHLHDKYTLHVKSKICEEQLVTICPISKMTTKTYLPIIVHAVKD